VELGVKDKEETKERRLVKRKYPAQKNRSVESRRSRWNIACELRAGDSPQGVRSPVATTQKTSNLNRKEDGKVLKEIIKEPCKMKKTDTKPRHTLSRGYGKKAGYHAIETVLRGGKVG